MEPPMVTNRRGWLTRLVSSRTRPVARMAPRVRLELIQLEDRLTPANITLVGAAIVDANDNPEIPALGREFYVQADFTTTNLPENASYRVSFDVDGTTLESSYINWGAGVAGKSSWYLFWGYWYPEPGKNTVKVTVDPDHSVAESTYADNTRSFTFTPQIGTIGAGYTVDQIRAAYGINAIPKFGSTPADGRGQTIAIVDNYNDPNILADLNAFDQAMTLTTGSSTSLYQQYGGASSILSVFNQSGVNITSRIAQSGIGPVPPVDPVPVADAQPEGEETMDVEWRTPSRPAPRSI